VHPPCPQPPKPLLPLTVCNWWQIGIGAAVRWSGRAGWLEMLNASTACVATAPAARHGLPHLQPLGKQPLAEAPTNCLQPNCNAQLVSTSPRAPWPCCTGRGRCVQGRGCRQMESSPVQAAAGKDPNCQLAPAPPATPLPRPGKGAKMVVMCECTQVQDQVCVLLSELMQCSSECTVGSKVCMVRCGTGLWAGQDR
jgi:hypothetical protein